MVDRRFLSFSVIEIMEKILNPFSDPRRGKQIVLSFFSMLDRIVAVGGRCAGNEKSCEIATRRPESAAGDAPIVTAVADLPPNRVGRDAFLSTVDGASFQAAPSKHHDLTLSRGE